MTMESVILFATIIAPIVVALSELMKRTGLVPKRFTPLSVMILAIVIAILAAPFTDLDITLRAWSGVFAGLSSMGLYELAALKSKHSRDKEEDLQ